MNLSTAKPLTDKLNHVKTFRYLNDLAIEVDYPAFSRNEEEEKANVRAILFAFLKQKFVGSKIRPNANSFSVRLDGQVHRKANKLRQVLEEEREWFDWFENNHDRIARVIRNNSSEFRHNSYFRYQQTDDGRHFVYFPFNPVNIYNYTSYGLSHFLQSIMNAYETDERLANVFEDAMALMEEEVQRREEEKARLLREELERYNQHLHSHIYRSATELQESEDPLDRLFAQKFVRWSEENHMPPRYAVDIGPEAMVAPGLKVKVMAPPNSEEEGWFVIPMFEGYPEPPEDYDFQGWGRVTRVDLEGERTRDGRSPIVVQEHLYTEFDSRYWEHLLPENYATLREVTNRLRQEAEEEIEPFLEEERRRREVQERLEAERRETLRQQEETLRRQVQENERRERARQEELRASIPIDADIFDLEVEEVQDGETPSEGVVEPNAQLLEAFRRQVTPQAGGVATEHGLYHNSQAIPLEQYVAINSDGQTRRFATANAALEFLGQTELAVFNYHEPHDEVNYVRRTNITF